MGWYTDDDRPQKKRKSNSDGGRIFFCIVLVIAFLFILGACISAFGFIGIFVAPGFALIVLYLFLSIFGSSRW